MTVVGVVGRGVPRELIEAAGAAPRRLVGDAAADRAEADRWLGRGLDPAANALLAALLADRFAQLDAIAFANDSEVALRLYLVLREIARVDPDAGVPPLHLLDVLHLPRDTSRDYTRAEFARFAAVLAEWTGTAPTEDSLAEAMARREGLRVALAARRPRLSGARFLELRVALDRDPLDDVRAALAAAPDARPTGGPRIVLSGSGHDGPAVTAAIEAAGADVVGDDHPDGELGLGLKSSALTLDALSDRYSADGPTPHRSSPADRAAHLARLVAERQADGVLVYVRRLDDAPLWDVGAQRAAAGVPVVVVDGQDYDTIDEAALRRALDEIGEVRRG